MESLRELLIHELKDLYSAENQIIKALPKMAKAAENEQLRAAFEEHLEITRKQVERLNETFKELNESPGRKKCKGMEGLLAEGNELISEEDEGPVRDAALICAGQKVEHYEMAAYGCARTFASLLGLNDIAAKLQATLDEEGEADRKLTDLAQSEINMEADEEDEPGDDDDNDDDDDEDVDGEESDETEAATAHSSDRP